MLRLCNLFACKFMHSARQRSAPRSSIDAFKPVCERARGRRYRCWSRWDHRVALALLSRAGVLVQRGPVLEARGGRRREGAEDKGSRHPDTWGLVMLAWDPPGSSRAALGVAGPTLAGLGETSPRCFHRGSSTSVVAPTVGQPPLVCVAGTA